MRATGRRVSARRNGWWHGLAGAVALAACAPPAVAAEAPCVVNAAAHAGAPALVAPPSYAQLTEAYVALERALRDRPPGPADRARVEREADRIAGMFFENDTVSACIGLARLARRVSEPASPADRLPADALVLESTPRVAVAGPGASFVVRVRSLAGDAGAPGGGEGLEVRVTGPDGTTARVPVQPGTWRAELDASAWAPGAYTLTAGYAGGPSGVPGRAFVASRAPTTVLGVLEARLARLEPAPAALAGAAATARARLGVLVGAEAPARAVEVLSDPPRLADDLEHEVAALEAGTNPYRRRPGDTWRVVQAEGLQVPVRVYAPAAACGDAARPLVVALHGAGADENMFHVGYGAGLARELADRHGYVLASPLATLLGGNPAFFDRIVEDLSADYTIDPDRVYLVGHSMGGMATAMLARARADRVAAGVCIAGGQVLPPGPCAPVLVIGAALDRVIPAPMLERAARGAAAAGLPVEWRLAPDLGHVLCVGPLLPEAVEWLMARRRAGPAGGD